MTSFSYGTYAPNEDLQKYIDDVWAQYEEENKSEGEKSDEDEFGGYTIKGGAERFMKNQLEKKHAAFKKQNKEHQTVNSYFETYFNNITKLKPDELLKEEDRYDFFKRKVGKPHDHFKELSKQTH